MKFDIGEFYKTVDKLLFRLKSDKYKGHFT
jgi:hypothetical protein